MADQPDHDLEPAQGDYGPDGPVLPDSSDRDTSPDSPEPF